jgi:hypothetical protein
MQSVDLGTGKDGAIHERRDGAALVAALQSGEAAVTQ